MAKNTKKNMAKKKKKRQKATFVKMTPKMSGECPSVKPYPRVLSVIVLVAAVFSGICFVSYLTSVLSTHAADLQSLFLALFTSLGVILPPLLAKSAAKRFPALLYRVLRVGYTAAVLFFTVTFVIFSVSLVAYKATPPENAGEVAVLVYGCRVKGDQPGEMLAERLDAAYTLLAQNPQAVAIVSGGLDTGEIDTEGEVMARYLMGLGIPDSRIVIDETAESTKGNIRAFERILAEEGWENRHLISVSSEFHMPRIAYLCGRYGLTCDYYPAPTRRWRLLFPSVVREYFAYGKMLIQNDYS